AASSTPAMSALRLAVPLVAVAIVVIIATLRSRAPRFQLAGMTAAGKPAGVVTVLAAASLVAVVAATAVLTSRTRGPRSAPVRSAKTVIVRDVSGSLSSGLYGRRLARAMRFAARQAGATAGLVIFADSAVELLPPSAPATAVGGLARFVAVTRTAARERLSETSDTSGTYETPKPAPGAFFGNIDISSGLDLPTPPLDRRR